MPPCRTSKRSTGTTTKALLGRQPTSCSKPSFWSASLPFMYVGRKAGLPFASYHPPSTALQRAGAGRLSCGARGSGATARGGTTTAGPQLQCASLQATVVVAAAHTARHAAGHCRGEHLGAASQPLFWRRADCRPQTGIASTARQSCQRGRRCRWRRRGAGQQFASAAGTSRGIQCRL